jgi:hypothetical protein
MSLSKSMLIENVDSFLQEIELSNPKQETIEWYLFNNLKKYLSSIADTENPIEIKNATGRLSIFCTESMNWDSELYKKCM